MVGRLRLLLMVSNKRNRCEHSDAELLHRSIDLIILQANEMPVFVLVVRALHDEIEAVIIAVKLLDMDAIFLGTARDERHQRWKSLAVWLSITRFNSACQPSARVWPLTSPCAICMERSVLPSPTSTS